MSKLAFEARKIRPFLLPFFVAFLTTVCLLEAFCQLSAERRFSGDWDVRFRKEAAAVEMYGEDIWLHGHRTLKTPFDPTSCEITSHNKWHVYWADVQCTAEDQLGQQWQYTARYSNTTTPMFGIPFLVDIGPLREMKVIPAKPSIKETGK
ncbi:hypothetical protein ACEN8I_18665 [Polaromonas sp. CT11-55]|uniref:hypothetical protein n=1 Tax=Polaromonas sp. CT11-55 TaxID=3243045 RepID=UPI0039A42EF9